MIFDKLQTDFKESIQSYLQDGNTDPVCAVLDSQEKQHYESDIKITIDTILRETMLKLLNDDGLNCEHLERLLRLAIMLARREDCSVSLPISVLSELFDCLTLQECETLFAFIDHNVQIWKEEFFFKNVKNHLLRTCNDLLRRLSRNQNTVFCGRILIFLANFFPLFERSGLNLTSEFNLDNSTAYALQADGEHLESTEQPQQNDTTSANAATETGESNIKINYNFYQKFWQLQEYFRNPSICYAKNNFKMFQNYCGEVLSVFSSYKIDLNSCFYFQALGLDKNDDDGNNIFFVKYLTNQKLLELQLSDSNFRRHILIQMLILFQYFTSNVKFRFENAVLSEEQRNWINETREKVNELIEETPPNGEEVRLVLEHLLKREEFWNNWKNEGCFELKEVNEEIDEVVNQNNQFIQASYTLTSKRARIGDYVRANNQNNKILIGNADMNRLWNFCPDNLEACRSQKRVFTPKLTGYFESVLKRPAEERLVHCSEPNFCWKALRLLSQKSNYFFVPSNQVVKPVNEYLGSVTDRLAQEYNITCKTVSDEHENKAADTEDISDDELLKNMDTNSVKSEDEQTLDAPDTNDSNTSEPTLADDVVNENFIEMVALKMADHWDVLSPLLGFTEDELEYIKENFPDPNARTKHLITIWKDEQGPEQATVKNLQKIIQSAKLDISFY